MRDFEGNIYLEVEEIIGVGVPRKTIYDGMERGSSLWQSMVDPEDRRRRLIRYDTLADKYKEKLKAALWDYMEPWEWKALQDAEAKEGPLDELKRQLKVACEKEYMLLERKYSYGLQTENARTRAEQLRCLCRSAAVVMKVGKWYAEQGIDYKKYDGYKVAGEWIDTNKRKYFPKQYVRSNPTGLAEQVRKVFVEKLPVEQVVCLPRVGNDNRLGENYAFGMGAMVRLLTDGKNAPVSYVYRKVKLLCRLNGFDEPSERTVREWERDVRLQLSVQKHGLENKASAKMRTSTPLARPMNAGDVWEMDGTRVQLQPHLTQDGRVKSLYIVAVRDVYSGAWLGWDFGYEENFFMYNKALKMATTLTGYLPCELKHDAFPGKKRDEWDRLRESLVKMGVKVTETRTATGKASTERAFGTLQSAFEMDSRAWIGQGIASSRDYNRPVKEYVEKVWRALKQEGWDWEAACRAEVEILMAYNNTPLSEYSKKYKNVDQSPMELHHSDRVTSRDEQGRDLSNVVGINNWEIAELFWPTRKVQIRNYAITIKVREELTYVVAEEKYYDLVTNRRHAEGVLVRYDPDDKSSIMIFDRHNGAFLHEVPHFERIQLAGKNPEYGRLQEFKTKQKALQTKIKQNIEEIKQGCDVDVHMGGLRPKQVVEQAQDAFFNRQAYTEPPAKEKKEKAAKSKSPKRELATGPIVEDYNRNLWEQLS